MLWLQPPREVLTPSIDTLASLRNVHPMTLSPFVSSPPKQQTTRRYCSRTSVPSIHSYWCTYHPDTIIQRPLKCCLPAVNGPCVFVFPGPCLPDLDALLYPRRREAPDQALGRARPSSLRQRPVPRGGEVAPAARLRPPHSLRSGALHASHALTVAMLRLLLLPLCRPWVLLGNVCTDNCRNTTGSFEIMGGIRCGSLVFCRSLCERHWLICHCCCNVDRYRRLQLVLGGRKANHPRQTLGASHLHPHAGLIVLVESVVSVSIHSSTYGVLKDTHLLLGGVGTHGARATRVAPPPRCT